MATRDVTGTNDIRHANTEPPTARKIVAAPWSLMRIVCLNGCSAGTTVSAHLLMGSDAVGTKAVPRVCPSCRGSGWVDLDSGQPVQAPPIPRRRRRRRRSDDSYDGDSDDVDADDDDDDDADYDELTDDDLPDIDEDVDQDLDQDIDRDGRQDDSGDDPEDGDEGPRSQS